MPTNIDCDAFLEYSITQIQKQRIRLFLIANGEDSWHQSVVDQILSHFNSNNTLLISSAIQTQRPLLRATTIAEARGHLGQERQCVIYDYRIGIDPDIVGITSGCITAGGLFVMLAPPMEEWAQYPDPQYQRIISANTPSPHSSLYIQRFIQQIKNNPHCILLDQHGKTPVLPNYETPHAAPCFADQEKAIESVIKVVTGKRRQPTLLIADRGRGKSAALGLAARHILKTTDMKIAVTAISRQSAQTVFKHATNNDTDIDSQRIHYIACDQLIETPQKIDLLLIDEAAAIPLSVTVKLLQLYPRIALACTLHGYEGTGKGYLIQLDKLLHQHCRGFRTCTLNTPIRWAENDPLEKALYTLLLLDTEISTLDKINDLTAIAIKQLSPQQLINEEQQLIQVYALLANTHYRTRPFDLRYLLDNPNLYLFGVFAQQQLVGVAIVNLEGHFSSQQSEQIYANQHRPNGHLLPQILCAQIGVNDASKSHIARVIRIAIHPDQQRRGLGTQLLQHIEGVFKSQVDNFGAVFALDKNSLNFWLKNGYQPLWIGHKKSKYTATHNAAVLKAFSNKGRHIISIASTKFRHNITPQLSRYGYEVDANLIVKIYRSLGKIIKPVTLTQQQQFDIDAVANHGHHLFNNISSLVTLVENILLEHHENFLSEIEKQFLVERILQNKPWSECHYPQQQTDKKQAEQHLVDIIQKV